MAIRQIFKVTRKTFLNPTGWIDANALKEQNKTLWQQLKDLFTAPTPQREETFEAAMQRLKLTDQDVVEQTKRYRQIALGLAGLGFLVFLYAFYLLFRYGAFFDWILGLAVTAVFFSQAFRFDFWALQMHSRKLGMTFQEWKAHILGSKRGSL